MTLISAPPNEDHSLPSKHQIYLGVTGSGKTQACRQLSGIPPKGARVILFDPSHDHPAGTVYFSNRADFARALAQADASGKGFRIGYDGPKSPDIHEWWCRCVHAVLDGKKLTYTITEELGRVSIGAAGTTPYHGWLINEGRKYGLIYHATTQFPARISKDVYDNAAVIYFGMQPPRLQRLFARDYNLDFEALQGLGELEFLRWQQRGAVSEKVKLSYRP